MIPHFVLATQILERPQLLLTLLLPFTTESIIDHYPYAGEAIGLAPSCFEAIKKHQDEAGAGVHYPFSCRVEVEMAAFLNDSGMSQSVIDQFLKLNYVHTSIICNGV